MSIISKEVLSWKLGFVLQSTLFLVTDVQNHRIIKVDLWGKTFEIVWSYPYHQYHPLYHVPKNHVQPFLKLLQGQWLRGAPFLSGKLRYINGQCICWSVHGIGDLVWFCCSDLITLLKEQAAASSDTQAGWQSLPPPPAPSPLQPVGGWMGCSTGFGRKQCLAKAVPGLFSLELGWHTLVLHSYISMKSSFVCFFFKRKKKSFSVFRVWGRKCLLGSYEFLQSFRTERSK